MVDIVLFFELHQPKRLRMQYGGNFPVDAEKIEELYFDDEMNREVFERVARQCYVPALKTLRECIREGGFKCALGLSGVFLEQCGMWGPEIIELIRQLAYTGSCELTAQTYFHSLASRISESEFREQVEMQTKVLQDLFDYKPTAIENTEFMYSNRIAKEFQGMGFKTAMTEGVDTMLGWRSPNYVYKAKGSDLKVLMRNYRLSDDIGFRFTSREWPEWPLTAEKYAGWLSGVGGDLVFLGMDFETFGEHHWPESGIHNFLRRLPHEVGKYSWLKFATPTDAASRHEPVDEIDVGSEISWADAERDDSAWLANEMQRHSFDVMKYVEPMAKSVGGRYLRTWRLLTTSDHYHYMSTKGGGAGAVHSYFSSFNSPVEAFLTFSWTLTDFRYKVYMALGGKSRYYRMLLGALPEGHSFHFYCGFAKPMGIKAGNLLELRNVLLELPEDAIDFHVKRGDLGRWAKDVLVCPQLAAALDGMRRVVAGARRDEVVAEVDKAISLAERELFGKEISLKDAPEFLTTPRQGGPERGTGVSATMEMEAEKDMPGAGPAEVHDIGDDY